MRVIIAGSREWDRLLLVTWAVEESGFDITQVVCGGAAGIDEMGKLWAGTQNLSVKMFYADWDRYSKRAGPLRNQRMAEYADALILIWDGTTPGSASMKSEARQAGLLIHEVIRDSKR